MSKIAPWIVTFLFLSVGLEAVFFQNSVGQIAARITVVGCVILSRFLRPKNENPDAAAWKGWPVEALSLICLISCTAMGLLVFCFSPNLYRNIGIISAVSIASLGFIAAHFMNSLRSPKVKAIP
jgi:CBS domain containing-hemolysin-like protein